MALKKHMGSLIGMVLLLICFVLALFHNGWNQPENKVQTISLNGTYLDGSRAIQIQEEEASLEKPTHFTLWGEMKNQKAENRELSRNTNVDALMVKGDSDLVYEGGWNLTSDDLEGCVIDQKAAYALFGDTNVTGQVITWNKRELIIRGVLEGDSGLLIVQGDEIKDEIFNFIALDLGDSLNTTGAVKNWMSQHGIDGERIDLLTFYRWGNAMILLLPLLMALSIFIPMVKKVTEMRRTPVKFVLYLSGLLLFIGIFLKVSGYKFHFPEDMIPTRWSDFSFWSELWEQKSVEIGTLLKSEKSHVEMKMITPFLQTGRYMVCSIILYFIFLRKLEIKTLEGYAVYVSVSMITVFLVIRFLGSRSLVHNQTVWFLMGVYLMGRLLIGMKREKPELEEEIVKV